jgi:poly(3-hydroxybutyrate) depolymerase
MPGQDAAIENDASQVDANNPDDANGGGDDAMVENDAGTEDGGGMNNMSAGCGSPHATGETVEMIDVDGMLRSYVLTIPSTYDPNTPMRLVFGWHASGGSGMGIRSMGIPEASGNTIITAHPNGTRINGGATGWVLNPMGIDAALYDALFTYLTTTLCIDLSQVHSYGFSFGGYMSNMLGCIRGEQLRTISPFHAGGPSANWTCTGKVSAMISNRVDDMTVPFSDGETSRDRWLLENGCDPTMSMPVEPAPCVEYFGCLNGERVLWCVEQTGGHAPPPDLPERTWAFISTF